MNTTQDNKTASGNAPRVYKHVEQRGDQFFAQIRTRDTVYLWSVFFSFGDAMTWAGDNLANGQAIADKYAESEAC